jgi:transposase-like protein
MVVTYIHCRHCNGIDVHPYGFYKEKRRYKCKPCQKIFLTEYTYEARKPDIAEKIIEMSMNGSGTRDIGRVLKISKDTVTAHLKKKKRMSPI